MSLCSTLALVEAFKRILWKKQFRIGIGLSHSHGKKLFHLLLYILLLLRFSGFIVIIFFNAVYE